MADAEKRPWLFFRTQEKLKNRGVKRTACGLVSWSGGCIWGHGGKYYHQTPAKYFVQAQVCSSKIKDLVHMDEI
jgi:hypothetical protein